MFFIYQINHKMFDFQNKTILIIGASGGIGSQAAETFHNLGAKIILASRKVDDLISTCSQLKNSLYFELDVSNKASIKKCFDMIEKENHNIDICLNASGIKGFTPIFNNNENYNDDETDDIFENIIKTNLLGYWYSTKAIANHMMRRKIHGSIINIGSIIGLSFVDKNLSGYACSKAGSMQLTKSLVNELSEFNIRINSISPGLLHTPFNYSRLNDKEEKKKYEQQIPLNFVGIAEDLIGAILLLASNKFSRYITGSDIVIDGGKSYYHKWKL